MKRILSTIILLTMVLAASTAASLYVAGKELNLNNTYSQVYADGLGGGYFDYNPSSKKLTLYGVTINRTGDGKNGIDSSVDGLTIVFNGTNNITTEYESLYLQASTTLENNGTVNITSTNYEAVFIKNTSTLTFIGGTWKLKGSSGIKGYYKNQTVIMKNKSGSSFFLSANGTTGCIHDLKELIIYNKLDVCDPIRDKLNQNYITTINDGIKYTNAIYGAGTTTPIKNQDVVIGSPAFELAGHGYSIHETSITNENITGSVSYYHSTKTLTMNGATTKTGCFVPRQDGMKLLVAGTNELSSGNGNSINLNGYNLTIQGTSTAKLKSGAIRLGSETDSYGKLSITGGVTVNITSYNVGYPGISFKNMEDEHSIISQQNDPYVVVNGSTLNISSANKPCITAGLQLIGTVVGSANAILCLMVDKDGNKVPALNYVPANPLYLYNNDISSLLTGDVSITTGTAYNLWVNGVQVNSRNCSNLNKAVTSGTCSYSNSSKQLSLSSVNISVNANSLVGYCIYNEISGLNIVSTGTNTLNTAGQAPSIRSVEDFTISGSGHLKASSTKESGIRFEKTLTISNTELTASGEYAIQGSYDYTTNQDSWSTVYVNNSKLHLSGSTQAIDVSIFDPDNNCYIITPSGGIKTGNTIYNANGKPAKTVELRQLIRYNLWINGTQVNELNYGNLQSLNTNYSGTMTFTPSTNTLKLNSFTTPIDFNGGNTFIKSTLSSLKIELTDDSHLYCRSSQEGLYATGSVEFCGTGSIYINSKQRAVYVGGELVLSGQAVVTAIGNNQYGVSARSLTMSAGTDLKALGGNDGKSLILDNPPSLTGVALPNTMYYDSSLKCVAYKATGEAVTKEYVKINSNNYTQISTSINEVNPIEETGETSIYTTSGTLVWKGKGQPQLPKGIYVMKKNGKVQKVQKN